MTIFAPCFLNLNIQSIAIPLNRPSFNRPGGGGRRGPQRPEEPYRINERITASKVRVVGENIAVDVYPIQQAIKMAQEQGLDLVEISPSADPPVCKITDYSKFKYEQKKKQKEIKAKALKVVIKELRFGPNTDEHDFNFKIKHAMNFLQTGFLHIKGSLTRLAFMEKPIRTTAYRSLVFLQQEKLVLHFTSPLIQTTKQIVLSNVPEHWQNLVNTQQRCLKVI